MTGAVVDAITLMLPLPISINHYWRRAYGRMILSQAARQFTREVWVVVHTAWPAQIPRPLRGALELTITLHAPDRRVRDLDNCAKSVQDALMKAGAFADDHQIDALHVLRGACQRPGCAVITLDMLR